jgi:hypothetical protein
VMLLQLIIVECNTSPDIQSDMFLHCQVNLERNAAWCCERAYSRKYSFSSRWLRLERSLCRREFMCVCVCVCLCVCVCVYMCV